MGNPHKGEVTFDVGETSYKIKLQFYELAVLERLAKIPAPKFLSREPDAWGFDDLLIVMRAAMSRTHNMSEFAVADLIDDVGLARVAELVGEVISVSSLVSDTGGEPKQDARPPK